MKRRNRGYSLVELLAVLSVFSVILGTVMLTLHAMYRTNSQMRDNLDNVVQRERLAAQLRSDTHEALSAELAEADGQPGSMTVLRLALHHARTIEYHLHAEKIARRVLSGERVHQQETYRVVPVLEKGWSIDSQRPHPLISVYIQQRPVESADGHHGLVPIRLDAAIRIVPAAADPSAH